MKHTYTYRVSVLSTEGIIIYMIQILGKNYFIKQKGL